MEKNKRVFLYTESAHLKESLSEFIQSFGGYEILDVDTSLKELYYHLNYLQPEIIIIDTKTHLLNISEFTSKLNTFDSKTPILFLSNRENDQLNDYLNSYRNSSYLLKKDIVNQLEDKLNYTEKLAQITIHD
ncbi:MAG: hypothetical protein H3C31_01460 [Brumimicrobium sp.]|nr:hypothetical protein [Brumimicrobium sp.]